jgi:hypothetical protein
MPEGSAGIQAAEEAAVRLTVGNITHKPFSLIHAFTRAEIIALI